MCSRALIASLAAAILALTAGAGSSRAADTDGRAGLRLIKVADLFHTVYVTAPPGDRRRVFIVLRTGTVLILLDGRLLSRPFLHIGRVLSLGDQEQGLLSMAFAPDYARSRRFYLSFTDRAGDSRIYELRASARDPNRAILSRARFVLGVDQPQFNHNGGLIAFGPDNLLYIGLGDGGGPNDLHGARGNAQNLGSLLGKLLRIYPRQVGRLRYLVPRSNPGVRYRGVRNEIYAYGLRNPWRFSFDRLTGDLTIADVGEGAVEEVNFARRGEARGANFGWRVFEGNRVNFPGESAPGHFPPVLTYGRDRGCAVTGGYVVRDRNVPQLYGRYVYGDFCRGDIRAVFLRRGRAIADTFTGLNVPKISSFGEDGRGRVWVTSLDGGVYLISG